MTNMGRESVTYKSMNICNEEFHETVGEFIFYSRAATCAIVLFCK